MYQIRKPSHILKMKGGKKITIEGLTAVSGGWRLRTQEVETQDDDEILSP